jgi:chemotaxis signal transduction protein
LGLQREGAGSSPVWVFDLGYLTRGIPTLVDKSSQVIIVCHAAQVIGLLVDELHGVPEFSASQIMPMPFGGSADGALVKHLIKANDGQVLIQAIDVNRLFSALMKQDSLACPA